MSVNIAIIIEKEHEDAFIFERSFVRNLTGNEVPNTKDSEEMFQWVLFFLCVDELKSDFYIDSFSPLGKYMTLSYSGSAISNKILVTWEHIQD